MKAEKVILGNIYTVDKNQPKAQAVAIAGGKFIYVGDEAGVKEYIGPAHHPGRHRPPFLLGEPCCHGPAGH